MPSFYSSRVCVKKTKLIEASFFLLLTEKADLWYNVAIIFEGDADLISATQI